MRVPLLCTPDVREEKDALLVLVEVRGSFKNVYEVASALSGIEGVEVVDAIANHVRGELEGYRILLSLRVSRSVRTRDVVDAIKSCKHVVNVAYERGESESVVINKFMFPLYGGDDKFAVRAIILREGALRELMEGLRRRIGTTTANVFIFHFGFHGGSQIAKCILEDTGIKTGKEAVEAVLAFHQACGFGRFELVDFDPRMPKAIIRAYDLIECKGVSASKPFSVLYRGVLAGALSSILGKLMDVTETRCAAVGDPFCEFYAHPA